MARMMLTLIAALRPVAGVSANPCYNGNIAEAVTQGNKYTYDNANSYKYGGKEFDTFGGTDLYDFHARYHAPSTGRFMTVDPMAEKYPGISPYMYCAGNPIAYIDPDGMQIFVNIDDMIYYYREIEKGRYGFVDEDGNEYEGDDNLSIYYAPFRYRIRNF